MTNGNNKLDGAEGYCLYQADRVYLVFLKKGGTATVDLSDAKGSFEVRWFDPRNGGALQGGTAVNGGGKRSIGGPPKDRDTDWVALIRPADPNRNYPPSVDAGAAHTPVAGDSGKNARIASRWRMPSRYPSRNSSWQKPRANRR